MSQVDGAKKQCILIVDDDAQLANVMAKRVMASAAHIEVIVHTDPVSIIETISG